MTKAGVSQTMFWSEDNRVQIIAGIIAAGPGAWLSNMGLEGLGMITALVIFFVIEFYLAPLRERLGEKGFEDFMRKLALGIILIFIFAVGQLAFLVAGRTFEQGHSRVFAAAYIAVVLGVGIGYFIRDIRKAK